LTNFRIFRTYLKTQFLVLLLIEVMVLFASVFCANYIWHFDNPALYESVLVDLWPKAAVITAITTISMLSTGLYQGQIREGMSGVLIRIVISFIAAAILSTLIFYIFPDFILGRGVVIVTFLQSFFIIGTVRAVFFELVDTSAFKKRIMVYGAGATAANIEIKLRRKSDRRGFDLIGYLLLDGQLRYVAEDRLLPLEGPLLGLCESNSIDEIVVAVNTIRDSTYVNELVQCRLHGITVIDILTFFEREAGQIRVDFLDPSWLITSEGFGKSGFQDVLKRGFDIISSLIIAILVLPLLLVTIIAIWIEDGILAPIFYSQIRVGKLGKEYRVYKFRSMTVDAEKPGEAIWAQKTDSRVTRVGAVIRKSRLDEFPQIFNVLNGTMSFVGPRPERPQFMEELKKQIPYYDERHLVKPGVTGWAQLLYPYGSSVNDSYQKHLFDMYYVKNHSLFLDLLILLQTVEVVLFGKGAR
jgi:sugar transferase (PEP-CTERM system associated)